MENRQVLIKGGNQTETYALTKGCPQESCLGPVLWLLTAEKIIRGFNRTKTQLLVFADDFLLLTEGAHHRELERYGQEALNKLTKIIQENGLTASKDKTITFTIKKKLSRLPVLKMEGQKIPSKGTLKYLGLTLSSNLPWHAHIATLKSKVLSHHQNLVKVTGRLWGVPSRLLKKWYKTVTESIFLYA